MRQFDCWRANLLEVRIHCGKLELMLLQGRECSTERLAVRRVQMFEFVSRDDQLLANVRVGLLELPERRRLDQRGAIERLRRLLALGCCDCVV
jgi:hypothetical protein